MLPDRNQPAKIKIVVLLVLAVLLFGLSRVVVSAGAEGSGIIATYYGNVISKDTESKIVLYGNNKKDSPYYENVRIEVRDKTNDKLIDTITPATNSGYNPNLLIAPFNDSGVYQIFLGMDSGGSGGFGYYYLYSVEGGKAEVLFDYDEFGKTHRYKAFFRDNYKVDVISRRQKQLFTIDIRHRDKDYLSQIYNDDGTLKAKRTASVSAVNTVFPIYNSSQQRFWLSVYQRVTGLYNADTLGYIQTNLSLNDGVFTAEYTTMNTFPEELPKLPRTGNK